MLCGKALDKLKKGLLPEGVGGTGKLRGKSYADIARLFEEELKQPVSPRSVRHYVKMLERQYADIQGPSRGRPTASVAAPNILDWWSSEFLRLTGMSASRLYRHMNTIAGLPVSKATFHNHLKRISQQAPIIDRPSKAALSHRCRLRVHMVVVEVERAKNYWVVLAGYEQITGFLNLKLFDVYAEHADHASRPKSKGRPKKMPEGPAQATIYLHDGPEDRVKLSDQLLQDFYDDTLKRLDLPLNRLWFSSAIEADSDVLQALRAEAPALQIERESTPLQTRVHRMPATSLTLAELVKLTAEYVNRHNTAFAQSAVDDMKTKVQRKLDAFKQRRWSQIDKRRRKTKAVENWLADFYSNDRLVKGTLKTFYGKPVRVGAQLK